MRRWPIALVLFVIGGMLGGLAIVGHLQGQQGQAVPPTAMSREFGSYRELVKHVLPAVVSVEAKGKVATVKRDGPQRRPRADLPPGFPEEFRKFFEQQPVPRHAFGSGFVIDAKGTVLTNYHVVDGADRVTVTTNDGNKFESSDIKGDKKNDLAVIKLKTNSPLPYLELGDSDAMEIGDRVLAIGAPFGLTGSVTSGIVSAKSRSGLTGNRSVYEDYIQTDAAINPGNSGGPLISMDGQVIGINTMIRSESGGFQGVGLAITSSLAKSIVDQLLHGGKVHHGYIGVQVAPLESEVATQLGVKTGLVVAKVFPDTPAAKAGLKSGDVITSLNGKPVKDGRDLQYVIGRVPVNKPVDVAVVRDGKAQDFQITIAEQPDDFGSVERTRSRVVPGDSESEEISIAKLGINIADLTPELAKEFGFADADTKGVVVVSVVPDGIAGESRLARGMLIQKIDRKSVNSAAEARDLLQKANLQKGILLQIQDAQGNTGYVSLKGEPATK
jgi:serine protease Do